MEADGEPDSSPKALVAPITAVVAGQVRRLRKCPPRPLSGPALAARLNQYGVNWNRTTVAKFETGLRSSITLQEFLALALALDVSPVMLLADPRSTESVPLAKNVDVDAWSALLWAIGFAELDERGGVYYRADRVVKSGAAFADLCQGLPTSPPAGGDAARDGYIRALLEAIKNILHAITDELGAPPPHLPSQIVVTARRYGVDLPEAEA